MSDEDEHVCDVCKLLVRVFNGKYAGCSVMSCTMGDEAMSVMKKLHEGYLAEIQAKFDAKEITSEERDILVDNIEKSLVFASSNVPALALMNGAKSNPLDMGNMVLAYMQTLIQEKLKEEGPAGILELVKLFGIPSPTADQENRINTPVPKSGKKDLN